MSDMNNIAYHASGRPIPTSYNQLAMMTFSSVNTETGLELEPISPATRHAIRVFLFLCQVQ